MTFGFPYPDENYVLFLEEFIENIKNGTENPKDYDFFRTNYDENFYDVARQMLDTGNLRKFREFLQTAIVRFQKIYNECIKNVPLSHNRYLYRTSSEYYNSIFRLGLKSGANLLSALNELPLSEDWTIVWDLIERRQNESDAVFFVDVPMSFLYKLQEEELSFEFSALILSDIAGANLDVASVMNRRITNAIIPSELIVGAFLKNTKQFVYNRSYDVDRFTMKLKTYSWDKWKAPVKVKVPSFV